MVTVDVDGTRVSSFDAATATPPARKQWYEPRREPKRPAKGYIGLQTHDPGDVVWFKDVSVRPLELPRPTGKTTAPPRPGVGTAIRRGANVVPARRAQPAAQPFRHAPCSKRADRNDRDQDGTGQQAAEPEPQPSEAQRVLRPERVIQRVPAREADRNRERAHDHHPCRLGHFVPPPTRGGAR
jgi:hypothetical protein